MALTLAPRAEFLKDNQTIRIVDASDYVGEAIDPADVRGILTITDPNSIAIVDNADFDNPDIDGAVSLTSGEYNLNLDAGEIVTGNYEIVYSVDTDFDDIADYTITINVEYSEELIPTVSISVVSSLVYGTISSTDVTDYSAVTLDTRTHSITFPASKGAIIDSNVNLNENISSLLLYIGDNIADVESGIIVKVSSENWIYATIEGSVTHTVADSSNISGVRVSYQTFYDQYVTALEENRQSLIVLQPAKEKLDESYNLWALNTLTGNPDEATIYVDNIIEILNTVDIPTDPVVPDGTLVNAALPGFATQWLSGSGAPDPSDGRDGDFYLDTDSNEYYTKVAGNWGSPIGILGSNTLIEFSANGTTGWTTTYANGLNYIRFSGDGGVTYSVPAKFIDGYIYYAYTSDGVSADFIATDDPGFTFNPVLEYIAVKKFDESHNGDLDATDFVGLFAKYRDNGIIAYSDTPSVSVPTDASGDNPIFPTDNPSIYVYDGDVDVTASWTFAVDSTTDVTASVVNDNEINITAIADDNGSITISCSRSGYDDLNVLMLVGKTKSGQAIVDNTSVDNETIIINDAYATDGNPSAAHGGTTIVAMDSLSTTRLAFMSFNGILRTYDFDQTDWSITGNSLDLSTEQPFSICSLSSTRVVIVCFNDSKFRAYDFDGTDWTLTGSASAVVGNGRITMLTSTTFALIDSTNNIIQTYSFNGSVFATVGNSFSFTNNAPSITSLSATSIVVGTLTEFRKHDFDGTDWTADGAAFSITLGVQNALLGLTSTKVAAWNSTTELLENYEFNGSIWESVDTGTSGVFTITPGSITLSLLIYPQIATTEDAGAGIQAYQFGDNRLSVKDDGVSTEKMDDTAKVAGLLMSGAITDDTPTDAELVAILGATSNYNDGDRIVVRDTSTNDIYIVAVYSSTYHYIKLTVAV